MARLHLFHMPASSVRKRSDCADVAGANRGMNCTWVARSSIEAAGIHGSIEVRLDVHIVVQIFCGAG
jgi:hypothetical protein